MQFELAHVIEDSLLALSAIDWIFYASEYETRKKYFLLLNFFNIH